MGTYLTRKEMEFGWTEVEINSMSDLERLIGTEIRDYPLPMGINLIYSDDSQEQGTHQTFSTAIIEEDGDSQPFFKSVLVAAFGENKNLKPLSKEQIGWLRENSQLVGTTTGQLVMQVNPFGIEAIDQFKSKVVVLGRRPQTLGFERMELNSLQEREMFVEGNLDNILFPKNIDLWINDDFLEDASEETLSLSIIWRDKTVQKIYGNVFFASVNTQGEIVSLSEEQLHYIKTHSEVFYDLNGKLNMVVDPYNVAIHSKNGGVDIE